MDIITLDEEYCSECNSYIGLIGLVGSGLCPRCQQEISALEAEEFDDAFGFDGDPEPSDDDATNEDEMPHLEISPLALPRHEKPRRAKNEVKE